MFFATPLAIAAAISVVSASPVEHKVKRTAVLPLRRSINVSSAKNMVQKGQDKISAINGVTSGVVRRAGSGVITNEIAIYVAQVVIGGKTWELIVDTGSANTWCGAEKACEPTKTGKSTGNAVSASYGSDSFSGTEYKDIVSFGGLSVESQSIGAANSSSGFPGVDGVIGFGPVALTEGTVENTNTVPTFMNNLKSQGSITTEVLGISFKPQAVPGTDDANGEIASGIAAPYWGLSIARLTYGTTTLASSGTAIVDTGTPLIYIPTGAYDAFLKAAKGTTDSLTGLPMFTTRPTADFSITLGSTTYTLTPAQYLMPTALYDSFGIPSGSFYAWINDGGPSGINTVIGQKFLEYYYSVYDTTNSRIGFATAA